MKSKQQSPTLTIRKFAPIDREYSIFEVLLDEEIIFDVSRDSEGNDEIAFHVTAANHVVRVDTLLQVIERCRNLLDEEGPT